MKKIVLGLAALAAGSVMAIESANIVGYQTVAVTKSKYVALGVQFKDVSETDRTVAIKDLLTVDTPYGRPTINGAADQIHVWTGMGWKKYFYSSTLNKWADSENASVETTDTVKNGDTVFFLRSSRGNGNVTLAGEVNVITPSVSYALTKSKYHFIAYPWPVDFPIDNFKDCVATPYGRPTLNGAADQVHVWNGMGWTKYFYSSTLLGYVKDGESVVTTDTIPAGQGVFFLRSSRGDTTLTFTKPAGL